MSASRHTEPKKKSSLISRLKDKLKTAIGIGKKKPHSAEKSHGPAEAHEPAKLHPHARPHKDDFSPSRDHTPRDPNAPRAERPARDDRERPARPPRREGEQRERGPRGPRPEGEPRGERSGEPRGDRPERGDRGPRREGDRGPRRGGRGGEEREKRAPIQNFEAQPPPSAPPVPEGPFPEAFEALGLSPSVLASIRESGYEIPTEIQQRAIPLVLELKDVIGASQTGTGKTAAFALPTLSRLGPPGNFRCLVLEPTRELALQVVEQFEKYGKHTGLRVIAIYGGVGYEKQRKALQEGVDVVVATPGRLLDFMSDGTANMKNLEVLVLDEVDRMLDMGFLPDVRRIVESTPKSRQTLFFSATMPPQIKSLAEFALKDPISVEVGIRFSPADTVSHYMYPVASDQREELLLAILKQTHFNSLMIFTRTKAQADQIYSSLKQTEEYKVAVMHSDISQKEREKALQGFRNGEFEIIVATDLAARGLDVSGVTHVINVMVPENSEDYVHRIGRTGRAKKEGDAYTLFSAEELPYVASIERLINQKIERKKLEGFSYKYTTVLDEEDKARAILRGKGKKKRR